MHGHGPRFASLSTASRGYGPNGAEIPMAAGRFTQNHPETRVVA